MLCRCRRTRNPQEFGLPSGYAVAPGENSSWAKQSDFVSAAFAALGAAGPRLRAASAFKLLDWTPDVCAYYETYYHIQDPKFAEYLCTLGYISADGIAKPALSAFLAGVGKLVGRTSDAMGGVSGAAVPGPPAPRPGPVAVTNLPLDRYPFVSAHDAATGYLRASDVLDDIVYAWTKTQNVSLGAQLACGARAFDWRPALGSVNGSALLGFHHGPVFIPHAMADALGEVVAWANERAGDGAEALVVIQLWACDGEGCDGAAAAVFAAAGVPLYSAMSPTIACGGNVTVGQAMAAGRLAGGGSVFATSECTGSIPAPFPPTFDDTMECNGFVNASERVAWRADLAACLALKVRGWHLLRVQYFLVCSFV